MSFLMVAASHGGREQRVRDVSGTECHLGAYTHARFLHEHSPPLVRIISIIHLKHHLFHETFSYPFKRGHFPLLCTPSNVAGTS